MAQKYWWVWIVAILALIAVGMLSQKQYDLFSTIGSTMTRTASSPVNPSATFAVTYTTIGATGKWGAIIVDNVAGGCTFPDGTNQYKDSMLSTSGLSKTIQVKAPASGSCTFTGYYQYSDQTANTPFAQLTINVCQAKTCTNFPNQCGSLSDGCGNTISCNCNSGYTCQSGSCIVCQTCASLGKTCGSVTGNCGALTCGTCTTGQQCISNICQTCKTDADTDCNNSVSDTEVLSYITKWANNQITDLQVLAGIQAWVMS